MCSSFSFFVMSMFTVFQDGAYLVRDSTRDPSSPYTLSILFGSKVWRLHIRNRRDGMFAIGSEKRDEEVMLCFTI